MAASIGSAQATLGFDPRAHPHGGSDALRARCFGHTIIGFEGGTGFVEGDPREPRWRPDRKMPDIREE